MESLLSSDDDGRGGHLGADKVVGAVATSTAVGGNIASRVLARERAGLVVDSKTIFGLLALDKAEAVVAGAASDDLGRQARDGANVASDVGDIVARELEAGVLDAVVFAEVELADVDVLVLGWVRSRAAAVCWVGAASCLGSGGRKGSNEDSRGNGEELHLVMCVG